MIMTAKKVAKEEVKKVPVPKTPDATAEFDAEGVMTEIASILNNAM